MITHPLRTERFDTEPMPNWPKTFKQAYCERVGCTDREYRRRLFRRSLYASARFLAPFIVVFQPRYFALDYELIEMAGEARNWKELDHAIRSFTQSNRLRGGLLRRALKIRVSGQKVRRIAGRLMTSVESSEA